MSTDAIVLLKEDHKTVKGLFRDFQQAGENANVRKGKIVGSIIEELTAHTYIENELVYPIVRQLLPDLEQETLEAYEEHHVADLLILELTTMKPTDEHFDAKVTVLIENVSHHIDEEESEWFPKVREGLNRAQLQDLGEGILKLKEKAPRRPQQPSALKKAFDAITA